MKVESRVCGVRGALGAREEVCVCVCVCVVYCAKGIKGRMGCVSWKECGKECGIVVWRNVVSVRRLCTLHHHLR